MLKRTFNIFLVKMFIQIGVNVIGLPEIKELYFYGANKERNVKQRYSY